MKITSSTGDIVQDANGNISKAISVAADTDTIDIFFSLPQPDGTPESIDATAARYLGPAMLSSHSMDA